MGALLSAHFPRSCWALMFWRVTTVFLPPALSFLICGPNGLPRSFSSMKMRIGGPPAWEVLSVLYCLHQKPKPWRLTRQILHAGSNLWLELDLLPSSCRDAVVDPYLAPQALCTVFPTPVIKLLRPPLSQIREIRQFTAQMPSPLGALSCPTGRSLHFLISIPTQFSLYHYLTSAHGFLVGWLWPWLSHWTATALSVETAFKHLVPAQLHRLEHIVDYLISSSKQSPGQAFL